MSTVIRARISSLVFIALAASVMLMGLLAAPSRATQASAAIAQTHLYAGTLEDGEKQLAAVLAKTPDDAEAIAGLGVIRLAKAIERLSQSLYRYGFHEPKMVDVPMFQLPIPLNPSPEPIGYEDFRAIMKTLVADLDAVDKALEPLGDKPVKLPLAIGKVRLNLTGDSTISGAVSLYEVYNALLLEGRGPKDGAESLVFAFDAGDVLWLRGYTHLLRAPLEFLLARDWREAFDAISPRLFARSTSPFTQALAQIQESKSGGFFSSSDVEIADAISFVHLIRWPATEKERLPGFRHHMKAMIALNQQMWASIRAEADNDREWLPNAKQTSLIPEMTISDERIDAWLAMTVELDAILDGKKLVPHWRFEKGLNLQKMLESPEAFDLVLLITGTGAIPYLEEGPQTDARVWQVMEAVFEGNFIGYAAWIN